MEQISLKKKLKGKKEMHLNKQKKKVMHMRLEYIFVVLFVSREYKSQQAAKFWELCRAQRLCNPV